MEHVNGGAMGSKRVWLEKLNPNLVLANVELVVEVNQTSPDKNPHREYIMTKIFLKYFSSLTVTLSQVIYRGGQ